MNILITGGAGFIGSNFVNNLALNDPRWEKIFILDSLTYAGNTANLQTAFSQKRVKFIQGDIRDSILVNDIMSNVQAVVHFAAESHVDRSIVNPIEFVSTNVLGTATLLQASLKHRIEKFIHVSTDEVYGSITYGSWDEKFPVSPNSPYSASKASSDLLALSYFKTYGLPVIVSRCSNNYGPYQYPEKFIPLSITNILDGGFIPIYGKGDQARDWIHVEDHCKALTLLLEKGKVGQIYNIGGSNEMTNLELAIKLLTILGKDQSYVKHVGDRLGHDLRYSVDFSKISQDCGYKPVRNFNESIYATVEWYKQNENWWRPLKNHVNKHEAQ